MNCMGFGRPLMSMMLGAFFLTLGFDHGWSQNTLMVILAHPDDELTVAPLLSKYVREGAEVYLVIATDGRLGVNDFSGLAAGEELATIRRAEMKCSAEKLGVELIHLDFHDQLKAGEGYDGHMPHAKALIKEIHGLLEKMQPNALITFGPDGGSNHLDHRLVGATVTAAYLSQKWDHDMTLFYVGTPADQISDPEERILRGVHSSYLNVQIAFEPTDAATAIEAIRCHQSQFQVDRVKSWLQERYRQHIIYLRSFEAPMTRSSSVF